MTVSRAMRRMLSVLQHQEEQCRAALEAAVGELRQWEAALAAAQARSRQGRWLVAASADTGELADRVAGVEEVRIAGRNAAAVMPKIAEAEQMVAMRRQEFLAKRVERRQTESLIEKAEAREAAEAQRRTQREMDGWFLNKRIRGQSAGKRMLDER
jgi:hypothetical protein